MRMPHLPLLPLRNNPHRIQTPTTPLLPPDRITSPIDRDLALRGREPQRLKELDVDIDVVLGAAHARVHDLDVADGLPVGGVVDADGGAAEGVVVGVADVVHFVLRDGDDGFAGGGGHVAGGVGGDGGGGVEGHLAGVGGGEGDGDGEGED